AGDRARQADLSVPGPLEREAAAEVADAEADVAQARADLERLLRREASLREQVLAAEAALEACQRVHPVDGPAGDHHDPEQEAAWSRPVGPAASPGAGAEAEPAPATTEPTVPEPAAPVEPEPVASGLGEPSPSLVPPTDVAPTPPDETEDEHLG